MEAAWCRLAIDRIWDCRSAHFPPACSNRNHTPDKVRRAAAQGSAAKRSCTFRTDARQKPVALRADRRPDSEPYDAADHRPRHYFLRWLGPAVRLGALVIWQLVRAGWDLHSSNRPLEILEYTGASLGASI